MWKDWKGALRNKNFRVNLILSLLGLMLFAISLPYFFNEILLPKPGVRLYDPVLLYFQPKDWSIEIFITLYFCTVISLAVNIKSPAIILLMLQMYVTVNFMRMTSLYLFTLEAPEGTIPLTDPFLATFVYGQPVYVKDLFFSGHISTLFILFLIERRFFFKVVLLSCTLLVAIMLGWQRVHYSLDMIAAPIIAWLVYLFYKKFNARFIALET